MKHQINVLLFIMEVYYNIIIRASLTYNNVYGIHINQYV